MANWLIQNEHLLQLDTPLGPEVLAPIKFICSEEISSLFNGRLTMISGETNIAPDKVIGKEFSVKLNSNGGESRYFHGFVHQFWAGDIENGMRTYHAELVPFLHLLNYTSDCRIFQNKNTLDIVYAILGEFGFSNLAKTQTTKHYPVRDYCVQYRETALHFINRILEEEGIFYFFEYDKDGHKMILADKNTNCKMGEADVSFDQGSYKTEGLKHFQRQHAFYSGKYEQNDFNFETPSTSLHTEQQGSATLKMAQKYGLYDYPGRYDATAKGKNITQHHFEAREMNYRQYNGTGNYTTFSAGKRFNLTDAPVVDDMGEYILTAVSHHAVDHTYLGTGGASGESSQHYENSFTCLPEKTTLRMPERYSKPIISGPQTAIVVGPKGSEIHTDNHGRVTVQFHWDRKGKRNEYSSCAVRVSQVWAGKNWGAVFIPRVGHEVIVHFLNGNPDCPIITGSVYNADNPMPYQYPFDETRSGIKSHSSKGGGDADANELYFEDKTGSEEVYIHAQKDFNQVVKHDKTVSINHDHTETVKNDKTIMVLEGNYTTTIQAGKATIEAAQSIQLKVGETTITLTPTGIYFSAQNFEVDK